MVYNKHKTVVINTTGDRFTWLDLNSNILARFCTLVCVTYIECVDATEHSLGCIIVSIVGLNTPVLATLPAATSIAYANMRLERVVLVTLPPDTYIV